jgi:hypothetical protein
VTSSDLRVTHGAGNSWDKKQFLTTPAPGAGFVERKVDSVEVERHGNVIETTGHIRITYVKDQEHHVYFVRVYAKSNGQWQLISHRTIRGVTGPLPTETR